MYTTALSEGGHTVPYTPAGQICLPGHPTGAQLSHMYYRVQNLAATSQIVYFRIDEWNDSACTSWNHREFNATVTIPAYAASAWVGNAVGFSDWSTYPSGTATFNNSKWYTITTYIGGGQDGVLQFYGSSSAISSFAYLITSDGTVAPPIKRISQHTLILTPHTTISTSSAATFAVTGYVAPADIGSDTGWYVRLKYSRQSNAQASIADPESLFTVKDLPLSGSGLFSFNDFACNGSWRVHIGSADTKTVYCFECVVIFRAFKSL